MSKICEYLMPYKSLIGGWIIPKNICDEVINYYKKSNDKKPGVRYLGGSKESGVSVNTDIKDSIDVYISGNEVFKLDNYFNCLKECLQNYLQKYTYANNVESFSINDDVNIQYYKPNGGFKVWHMENSGSQKNLHRHLVFMTYLNDVPDGGTEFLYQGLKTPAKKGLTVIWPATWTHTHKGEISKTKEKYIITGWYSFERHNNE